MGLTGLEPVTLRLSSACSNQLSYRPRSITRVKFKFKFKILGYGGNRARTGNILLAKQVLYQLSYTPPVEALLHVTSYES